MTGSSTLATLGAWAASLVLAALAGCSEEAPPPELPPRAIQWVSVSAAPAGERRVLSGIVTAVADTRLAFEVGGTVYSVEVSLGDRVKAGQVLARLDPEPFQLAVRNAEAALSEARAQREAARADHERAQSLYQARVASRQRVDRATAQRESRESQVEAAEARLGLARRDLRRAVLTAPFDGRISVREVDPAMKVTTGQTVFEMDGEASGLRVEVQLPETLISRVRQGDPVEVGFPSKQPGFDVGDRRFAAVLAEVGSRAGAGNAFPVRADLLDPPAGLRPGMSAELAFSIPPDRSWVADLDGFLVPIAAVLPEADDGFSVFVYDPETSTLEKRRVRTGGLRENDVFVLEGLAEGDVIATAGVPFLSDGQRVTLFEGQLMPGAR